MYSSRKVIPTKNRAIHGSYTRTNKRNEADNDEHDTVYYSDNDAPDLAENRVTDTASLDKSNSQYQKKQTKYRIFHQIFQKLEWQT